MAASDPKLKPCMMTIEVYPRLLTSKDKAKTP